MTILERLAILLGRVLSLGFLVIALMMGYEVLARYGFRAPTYWAHEIATILAASAFVIGGAFCMAENTHMRVDLFVERARPGLRRAAEIVSLLAGTIYLAGMCWAGWIMSQRSVFRFTADGAWNPERSGSTWNTPLPAFVKFALLVGSILFLMIVIQRLWQAVRGRR